MVHVRRATARTLLVIGAAAGLVLAGTAGAAVSDDTQYPPPKKPTISVDVEAVCPGGVPTIDYAVTVTGTKADTTTITVDAPSGDDVVLTGRPLTGQIPWTGPLAVVDVTFEVGKTEVTVPVDLNVCPPEESVPPSDDLPRTGIEALPLLAAAAGLVLVGGVAVTLAVVRRRRVGSDE